MKKETYWFVGLIIFGAIIRLLYLGILPPGDDHAFISRLPTAFAGIISLVIFSIIIKKLTKNTLLTFYATLALALLPWHIEQSRIVSPPMLGLVMMLLLALVWIYVRDLRARFMSLFVAGIAFYLVYPSMWLFHPPFNFPTIRDYVANIFKLISFEFLFFSNDAFWKGGIRSFGIMLPSLFLLFIIGTLEGLTKFQKKHLLFMLPFIVIWFVASANPMFPEEREYFLTVPYFAILLGLGAYALHNFFRKSHLFFKGLIILFALLVVYEYLIFAHFYTNHYSQRIQNEIPKELRNF